MTGRLKHQVDGGLQLLPPEGESTPAPADGSGRRAEFSALFQKVERDLRVFIRALVRDRARSEDVLQDAAVDLWKKFDSYDPSRPFAAWARGMALTCVRRNLSRARRESTPIAEPTIVAVFEAQDRLAADPAEMNALRNCMARLPQDKRILIDLRYGAGLTLSEIAGRVRSTLDAVHKNLSRLRVALLACMRKQLAVRR